MADGEGQPRVLAFAPIFNEEHRVGPLLDAFDRLHAAGVVDEVLLVDDGSTDGTAAALRAHPALKVITHPLNRGIGAAIKRAYRYALEQGFDIFVITAGNGKDDPALIPALIDPIVQDEADYVQGSRFLQGGVSQGLPRHREALMRVFTLTFSVLSRRRLTDASNGFRAYRVALLRDPEIKWEQEWLGDGYQLEYYMHFKAINGGYRFLEVPVSKIYRHEPGAPYTKFRPRDWVNSLRPMFLLRFGLKR